MPLVGTTDVIACLQYKLSTDKGHCPRPSLTSHAHVITKGGEVAQVNILLFEEDEFVYCHSKAVRAEIACTPRDWS
jgi:hypothetical protein